MSRVKWTCPQCRKNYSVPSTAGLVLCPACKKPTSPPAVTKRKGFSAATIAAIVMLLLTPLSAGILNLFMSAEKVAELRKLIPQLDPSRSLVAKWLRENLNDGTWEEVKWWPTVESQALYDANARRIITQIESAKIRFEDRRNDEFDWQRRHENTLATWKLHWESFEKIGLRKFCGMKYRTRSPMGGKVIQSQIFEIIDGVAVPIENNEIVEYPAYPQQSVRWPKYDGWLFLNDPDYDPSPEIPAKNLAERLQAATIWREPPKPHQKPLEPIEQQEVEFPVPQRQIPVPQPIRPRVDEIDRPPEGIVELPQDKPGDIPRKIREYFERADDAKLGMIEKLEKEIEQFEIVNRGAIGDEKIRSRQQISLLEKSLATLKKSTIAAFFPLQMVSIGDIGTFESLLVRSVVDDKTLIALPSHNVVPSQFNGCVVIHPIPTKSIKVGQKALQGEFFRITATERQPSNVMHDERIIEFLRKTFGNPNINVVVEPVKKSDIEKYRKQYQEEKKAKQK